jgi:L-alanine-DL-glutamate epimerase-like enolase superfamily enzyme
MPDSNIRVLEAQAYFSDERGRESFKFGDAVVDSVTLCHVRVRVENRRGQVADGWGAIFLSYPWAFRDPAITNADKNAAMQRVTERLCQRAAEYNRFAHPIDIFINLESDLSAISAEVCRQMPYLGALVCASPLDAAIHDAFGNANRVSSYAIDHDLSRHLGDEFKGRRLSDFIRPAFAPSVPIFHTVGGLDKLHSAEVAPDTPDDGLPRSLDSWIKRDGVYGFKVKLRGNDLDWDIDRVSSVYAVAAETLGRPDTIQISVDANEQCEDAAYMVEMLHRLREANEAAYTSICFVEQPTERDVRAHRFDMRELAALKPVFIDESLLSLDDMDLALTLGWSGIVLKTCKCHSKALLFAARAEAQRIPYAVQDLTNPGIALLHSVGLAARLNPAFGLEANARQYYPQTSQVEAAHHPDIFRVRDGVVKTKSLGGFGLGYRLDQIGHPWPRGQRPRA